MRMDRREFLRGAMAMGMTLGVGPTMAACGGVQRMPLTDHTSSNDVSTALTPTCRTILQLAGLAPSGHNSQPWRVRIEAPGMWIIEADPKRRLPAVDPWNREGMLSLGAFAENLSLAAGAAGYAAELNVVGRNCFDRDIFQVRLHKDRPIAYPMQRLKGRRTVKHGYRSDPIRPRDVEILNDLTGGRLVFFPRGSMHAGCIRDLTVESYRIQSGRDTAQQEFVQWLRLSNAAAREHRDGLTTAGMEIKGAAGWYLRSFAKPEDFLKPSYREKAVDQIARLAAQGGGWFVITSPGDSLADLLAAGRSFERMALVARELGIALHPMTQVLEEQHGQDRFMAHHKGGAIPQFVLRVGYLDRYPDPVSLRRPVEWFTYIVEDH